MNKFKKLLLTLAPLSAVAIATPIILTSCSTNSSNTGGGNGQINPNGDLTPDDTNKHGFVPKTVDGLYKKVEDTVKSGKQGEEHTQVEAAFTAYNSPKEEDVKDAINMWSFNKWFEASKIEGVTKYISNFVNEINVIKKVSNTAKEETKPKWDISFTYKFQIAVKSGNKTENILGERSFSASDIVLSSTVPFTTEAKMLMVDGKSLLDKKPTTLYTSKADAQESDVVKKVKDFVTASNSTFDSKAVFKSFVTNKEIKGQQEQANQKDGEWLESIQRPNGVQLSDDKKTINVDLSKIESTAKWYELSKESDESTVKKTVYTESGNPKVKNLNDAFKNLIFGKDKFTSIVIEKEEVSSTSPKSINFTIKLTNKDNTNSTLNLNFSNVFVPKTLASPIWDVEKLKKYPSLQLQGNTVTLPLTTTDNPTWDNASVNTSYNDIKTKFSNVDIQKKITDLIDLKDYQTPTLSLGNEVVDGTSSNMDITISFKKKADKDGTDTNPTLIFKVKGFKKS